MGLAIRGMVRGHGELIDMGMCIHACSRYTYALGHMDIGAYSCIGFRGLVSPKLLIRIWVQGWDGTNPS